MMPPSRGPRPGTPSGSPSGPDKLEAAQELIAQGKLDAAVQQLRKLLTQDPSNPRTAGALCFALLCKGEFVQAEFVVRETLKRVPDHYGLVSSLSRALRGQGRFEEAQALLQDFLARHPGDPLVTQDAVDMMLNSGAWAEAYALLESARAGGWLTDPLRRLRAMVLHKLGRMDEGMAELWSLQQEMRAGAVAEEALAAMGNYDANTTTAQRVALHQRFGRVVVEAAESLRFRHPPGDDPKRRLKVGVLSSDFRAHAVASFARPLVAGLDRRQFTVTLYHTGYARDHVTQEFERLADRYVPLLNATPDTVARRIAADRVDVLIELGGLTDNNNCGALAMKPAPVIITAIGYPATTGLSTVDYRFVDSATDPPGTEGHCVEKLLRLDPCFLCYRPLGDLVDVEPGPSARGQPFTFGSFNNIVKVSSASLALWARILREAPEARLRFRISQPVTRATIESIRDRIIAAGIPGERLELVPYLKGFQAHLKDFANVDLALDPFPYHGTTTTFESLAMGVPVLTRAGDAHVSRVGVSILRGVGLETFVAESDEAFVARAVELARTPAPLHALRSTLRACLLDSPLCDAKAYGERVSAAVRTAWHNACTTTQ